MRSAALGAQRPVVVTAGAGAERVAQGRVGDDPGRAGAERAAAEGLDGRGPLLRAGALARTFRGAAAALADRLPRPGLLDEREDVERAALDALDGARDLRLERADDGDAGDVQGADLFLASAGAAEPSSAAVVAVRTMPTARLPVYRPDAS
jgi:hypothetical protein